MWSKGRESMPCGILELKFVLWHSIGTPKGSPPCCSWQAWMPWRPLELCQWELYLLVGPHKRHCKPGRRCSKQERERQNLQDHQAGVWQVQRRFWHSNHEQEGATTHDRSRARCTMDGTLQWGSEQTTTTTDSDMQEVGTDLDVNTNPQEKRRS